MKFNTKYSDSILDACLPFISKYGYQQSLYVALKSMGLSPATAKKYTTDDLVQYHNNHLNKKLNTTESTLTKRVIDLTRQRLELQQPYIKHYQEYCGNQWMISDEIWWRAGDVSVDYNYYTKRALLVYIYGATELYMTTNADWKDFMMRRFADVNFVGMNVSKAQQFASFGSLQLINILKNKT